jgi:hypothetical protein
MCELAVGIVIVSIKILRQTGFLTVLLGLIVLLPIFEEPITPTVIMGADFAGIVCGSERFTRSLVGRMRYFRLALASFVAVLVGLMMNRPLLNSLVLFVLSHDESSMLEWEGLATAVPLCGRRCLEARHVIRHANLTGRLQLPGAKPLLARGIDSIGA